MVAAGASSSSKGGGTVSSRAKKSKGRKSRRTNDYTTTKEEVPHASLPWSVVDLPQEAVAGAGQDDEDFFQGFSVDDADFMGLTEVEGVEVIRDKDGMTKFVMKKPKATKGDVGKKAREMEKSNTSDLPLVSFDEEERDEDGEEEQAFSTGFAVLGEHGTEEGEGAAEKWTAEEVKTKLPAWKKLDLTLHRVLYEALFKSNFHTPTSIQQATLPISVGRSATARRDVVGIAQTGSGKTLAYALPVLHWIASNTHDDRQMRLIDGVRDDETATRLAALIMTPTRELALQVTKHISALINVTSTSDRRWASVVTLTGGMSEEKQRRLLQGYNGRGVDVVVATPGRVWDVCKGDDAFVKRIKTTRFLVVDEADRMIETGHFAELKNIFALVQRQQRVDELTTTTAARVFGGVEDMQTFIYSATLSKELQRNLKRSNRRQQKRSEQSLSVLEQLFEAIDFRDDEPVVVDQSTSTRVAENVFEVKAECLQKDKDVYLYYFLLRFPGRTVVFLNAIDGIRRLHPLLVNLGIAVQPLHSQLQQKQRLKNMDRFRSQNVSLANGGSSVLLATDVAARGLDIADVDHVVHFQIPRSADSYVHRSGRTARAGNKGVSLALIDPTEKRTWQSLCKGLARDENAVPVMPIEYAFLPALRTRVELARSIDKATHAQKKDAHDDAWLRKLAEEAELDVSEEERDPDDDGHHNGKRGKATKGAAGNVAALRAQLRQALQTPLRARGISLKYITSGTRDFLDGLIRDEQHDQMLGVQRSSVQADVQKSSKAKKRANGDGEQVERKRARA